MQFSLWIFVKAADCWGCSFMASSPRHCPCMTTHAWPVSPQHEQCSATPAPRLQTRRRESGIRSNNYASDLLFAAGKVRCSGSQNNTNIFGVPGCRSFCLSSLSLGILKQDIDEFERYLYLVLVYIRYLENLISNSLFRLFRNLAPLSRK